LVAVGDGDGAGVVVANGEERDDIERETAEEREERERERCVRNGGFIWLWGYFGPTNSEGLLCKHFF